MYKYVTDDGLFMTWCDYAYIYNFALDNINYRISGISYIVNEG